VNIHRYTFIKKSIKDSSAAIKGIEGKSEYEIVQHTIGKLNRYYEDSQTISKFLSFVREKGERYSST